MPAAGRERVEVYDTTLRDGAQSPGVELGGDEKLAIARQLALLGVDAIEAGFPAASAADLESVALVAREVEGPTIKALARARTADVDLAWRALRDAERPRVVIFVPTSDVQIDDVLRASRAEVLERTRAAVAHARSLFDEIEFSPMDATRSDPDFLAEVVDLAIAEGSTVISVPDTVGYAMPHELSELLHGLRRRVPALAGVTLGVHCHDDLGLAVANSLAGVLAGARSVEGTINGIGERAGNAALEELAVLLSVRGDALGLHTGIETGELGPTSELVSRLTDCPPAPHKAIVGQNAFAHHPAAQTAMSRNPSSYRVVDPASLGVSAPAWE